MYELKLFHHGSKADANIHRYHGTYFQCGIMLLGQGVVILGRVSRNALSARNRLPHLLYFRVLLMHFLLMGARSASGREKPTNSVLDHLPVRRIRT